MTTLYARTLFPSPLAPLAAPTPPGAIPPLVYRIHHPSARTSYSFSSGFKAKNHTTVLSTTSQLSRFGLAHIHAATNISSPFISVYDNKDHAERVARWVAAKRGEETLVVEIDTQYLGRGPVLRAADLLREEAEQEAVSGVGRRDSAVSGGAGVGLQGREEEDSAWLHEGEYLFMYRIPMQAVRGEIVVARGEVRMESGGIGVIGGR
ncbi:hypothetical protein DE146DRAFT_789108 [Phaeosphaeria sp. MPI-PUGE-AT-0046c]|nr:hypothetical protein DE146DRAFT_789108 [Phaeosphaeria sp. MPI-PUGE-AT-0046c]